MSTESIITMNLQSEVPLPENIEEISLDVIYVTSVALIARAKFESQEDSDAIVHAVFTYTDAKGYDRPIVAQIIQQYFDQMVSEIKKEEQDGN